MDHQKIYEKYRNLYNSYVNEFDDDFTAIEKKINELDSLDVRSKEFQKELLFLDNLFLITLDRVYLLVNDLIDLNFASKFKDLHDILYSIKNSLENVLFDENDENSMILFNNLSFTTIFCLNEFKNNIEKIQKAKLEKTAIIIETEIILLKKIRLIRKKLLEQKITKVSLDINRIKMDLEDKYRSAIPNVAIVKRPLFKKLISNKLILSERNKKSESSILSYHDILSLLDIELDVNLFFEVTKKNNIAIDNEFLNIAKDMLDIDIEISRIPKNIIDFIFNYMNEFQYNDVLIPWFNFGVLDDNSIFKDKNITALVKDKSSKKMFTEIYGDNFDIDFSSKAIDKYELIKSNFDNEFIKEQLSNIIPDDIFDINYLKKATETPKIKFSSIEDLNELYKSYDLIIGVQENNRDSMTLYINSDGKEIAIEDNIPNLNLMATCANLKDDGTGFFIIDNDFLLKRDSKNIIMNLSKFGIYIDAILKYNIKHKEMNDLDLSEKIILIIKRNTRSKIFVAELSNNKNYNNTVLKNLKRRQNGQIPSLGYLTDIEDFFSFNSFYDGIEYEKTIMASKFDKVKFKDIELSNNDVNKKKNNSIFLFYSGSGIRASTSSNDYKINKEEFYKDFNQNYEIEKLNSKYEELSHAKDHVDKIMEKLELYFPNDLYEEYSKRKIKLIHLFFDLKIDLSKLSRFNQFDYELLRIDFNPDKASAEFVAKYLNNKNGQKLLNSLRTKYNSLGAYELDIYRLMDKYIAIPDLDMQKDILRTDSLISDVSLECNSFKKNLWKFPQRNKSIKKSVELFYVGKRMGHWIESLPFPLSSILTSCGADSDIEHRVRYLIHFFEAFSEFNATVLLSAVIKNKSLCNNEFRKCLSDISHPNWIYNPSFGNWNFLGRCLAKKIRNLINDKEYRKIIFELFCNPSRDFMEMLTNKDLYNIFSESSQYRNRWIGHGPPVNLNENRLRFETLVELLSKTRKIVNNAFDDSLLIQPVPDSMSYDGAVYSTKVKKITGITPAFKDIRVKTLEQPLKQNTLYLLHSGQYNALELLPFLRMMPGPKTEQNACYFYNRYHAKKVGDEIELISYHFEQDHKASAPYEQFKTLISLFDYQK